MAGGRGDRLAAAECLEGLAATGDRTRAALEQAARLLGTAHAIREAAGGPVAPADLPAYERDVRMVREALGEENFLLAWLAGQDADIEVDLLPAEGTIRRP